MAGRTELIGHSLDALEQAIEVGVVGGDTHRCADRTDGASVEALTKTRDAEFIAEAGARDLRRNAERALGSAWIAKAASADGHAAFARSCLDELVRQRAPITYDIERDDAAAPVGIARTVEVNPIAERTKSIEERRGEGRDMRRHRAHVEAFDPA